MSHYSEIEDHGTNSSSIILAIIIAVGFAGLGAGISRIALARYMRIELATPALLVSSITTWFMLARALSSTASGLLADIATRARHLSASLPLILISLIVYATSTSTSPYTILAFSFAWGFLSGMVWPATQAYTSLLAGRSKSNTVMSAYFAVGSLGISGGIYLYGLLPLDNRASIQVGSLFFLASGVILLLALTKAKNKLASLLPRPRTKTTRLRGALGSYTLWILLAAFSAGFASGLTREYLYIYLAEAYSLTKESLSTLISLAGVIAFAGGIAVGPVADKIGARKTLLAIMSIGLTGSLLLAFSPTLIVAALGLAFLSTATRSSLPLTRNATLLGTKKYAATLVGASNTASNIGQMVSPIIAGALYDKLDQEKILATLEGGETPFLAAASIFAATLLVKPRTRDNQKALSEKHKNLKITAANSKEH